MFGAEWNEIEDNNDDGTYTEYEHVDGKWGALIMSDGSLKVRKRDENGAWMAYSYLGDMDELISILLSLQSSRTPDF